MNPPFLEVPIHVVDFEFIQPDGEMPTPICMVDKELHSQDIHRYWFEQGCQPCPLSFDGIYVAYYAIAEMNCHLALDWPLPQYLIDPYMEFRQITNGLKLPAGNSLIGACTYYGISGTSGVVKDAMRGRIMAGYPFTEEEKTAILAYCEQDVLMTEQLFNAMVNEFDDTNRVFLRGRYAKALSCIERNGIPIDIDTYNKLRNNWDDIVQKLIDRINPRYDVYEGRTFKIDKFRKYLHDNSIPWEATPSGLPRLDEEYFKDRTKAYPQLAPLKDLRYSMGQLRLNDLAIGKDGRNRCNLRPLASKTGRNQPSSSKYVFGPAVWLRYLIKPTDGMAISYIDFEQQEFGIASALSGDIVMQRAYNSKDPYISFAIMAGLAPEHATKASHPKERELCKTIVLASNYQMTEYGLAAYADITTVRAKILLQTYKTAFSTFVEWSDNMLSRARMGGWIITPMNWRLYTQHAKDRTIRNFPMQGTGANILQICCVYLIERGIRVLGTVHDALLVEAPVNEIDAKTKQAQDIMEQVSEGILNFRLRTDAKIVKYPERYSDKRGEEMWNTITSLLDGIT